MASAFLIVIALLVLMVWRLVFAVVHRRPSLRDIADAHQRHGYPFEQRPPTLDHPWNEVIAEAGFEPLSDRASLIDAKNRARAYLRRVIAITGATQKDNHYILDVGKTRFQVRDRYVRRLRDSTNSESRYDGTCFYVVNRGIPEAEEIASVLLLLKNNPALFDQWANQNGVPFKPDGQVFADAQ